MLRLILVLLFTLSFAGCMDLNGSSSSHDESDVENPSGIWIGSQSIVGTGVFDMKTIIYNGRIYGISEDAGVSYAGTYEMAESIYMVSDGREDSSTSYGLYDLYDNNNKFAVGLVSATVDEQNVFTGSFQNTAFQEGELFSYYSTVYEKSVSLSDISGEHATADMDITVSDEGVISGTIDGCDVTGDIYVPEEGKNIFDISMTMSGCDNAGAYEGLGAVMLDDSDTPYFMALTANDIRMEGVGFTLNAVPDSFVTAEALSYETVQAKAVESVSSRAVEADTTSFATTLTGVTHDNESYHRQDIYYNIADSSYQNSNFTLAKFYNGDTKEISSITNSNFSGSNFDSTLFGWEYNDYFANTKIDDSDFSNSTFSKESVTMYGSYTMHFSPKNTNFSNSSFDRINLNVDRSGNDFSGTTIYNSDFTISGSNNDFSNTAFDQTTLTIDSGGSGADFTDARLDYVKELNIYSDVDLTDTYIYAGDTRVYSYVDFSVADIYDIGTLSLYSEANFSGANLSNPHDSEAGTNINFYSNILNPAAAQALKDDISSAIFDIIMSLIGDDVSSSTHDVLSFYEGGNFSGANLNRSNILMHRDLYEDDDYVNNDLILLNVNFSRADFTNAGVYRQGDMFSNDRLNYHPIFLGCDFRAANFANASLGNAYFMLSDMRYANLKGAEKPNSTIGLRTSDYSNAWWYDGSRCAAISVGLCIPVPSAFNTGLTYEEYLDGKSDSDKVEENFKKKAQEVVDKGVSIIKDPVGSVKKMFHW